MELIKIDLPEFQGIEKSKAESIKTTFEPMAKMIQEIEDVFNQIILESKKGITKDLTNRAKRTRLDIGKIRIETGKLKEKQKEYIKLEDKAIMGVHNIIVWAVKEREDKLKEIEDYFDILEKNRLIALQNERVDLLLKYVPDAFERNLSSMENDVWKAYFNSKKNEYEDRVESERKAIEEKARLERESYELELKRERDQSAKLAEQIAAKEESERKAIEEKARLEELELTKGDSFKVMDLINDLNLLKTKYSFSSSKNKKKYLEVGILLDKIVNHISN